MSPILLNDERRRTPRISLPLTIRVEAQGFWSEMTSLISVSQHGAGFYLRRRSEVGQLLFLTMPLPSYLRLFDQTAPQYGIWSIIRHSNPNAVADPTGYYTGVAFVGRYAPAGYKQNPLGFYKITGVKKDGLCKIEPDESIMSPRRHSRHQIPVEVFIAVLDERKNIVSGERTVTENISSGGAAVFSLLDVKVGDIVKVISEQHNFSAFAVVRNHRVGKDNLPRLHLQFDGVQFPLDGIG
jgi:hypothetical protein